MQRISTLEPGKDRTREGCAQPGERETANAGTGAQVALKLVERRARRLRSAEAHVADVRLALEQEISWTIENTQATVSSVARAAGLSVKAAQAAVERKDSPRRGSKSVPTNDKLRSDTSHA